MELNEKVTKVLSILSHATKDMPQTMTNKIIESYGQDPFLILISCLLSLRAKDTVTYPVSKKLFEIAKTPNEILSLSVEQLEKIFRPLGFFRKKALVVKSVTKELIDKYSGKVPNTREELLSIKGVGPKTANLVLAKAFNIPAICVDTHVHRISNRLGWVSTNTPEQTEKELEKIIPKDKWIAVNDLLVIWGQNICVPISPFCSKCVLFNLCPKINVKISR